MKTCLHFFLLALAALNFGITAHAETFTWINTSGGDWNDPANWLRTDIEYCTNPDDPEDPFYECNPHTLPDMNDNVFITADGTYTVTLNSSATIGSLMLGGSIGTQTLSFSGGVLRFGGDSLIGDHAALALNGQLSSEFGVTLTVNGVMNWTNGPVALDGLLFLSSGASLNLIGNTIHEFYCLVYNYGTTRITGTATLRANSGNGAAYFVNETNGLVDIQGDGGLAGSNGSYERIYNYGMVRRSGGTGNMNLTVMFLNYGTFDIQTGSVNLNWPNSFLLTADNRPASLLSVQVRASRQRRVRRRSTVPKGDR